MLADKLVEDTVAAQHNLYTAIFTGTGFPQVYSVYAKAGERKLLTLGDNTSGSTSVYDLELGTVVSEGTSRTASITPIGNGWYRCSNTGSLPGSQRVYIGMRATAGNGTYTGNGTSGIYIWGAQLSDSASLDQYVNNPVAAPSSTAYYGPRFDYDPVTLQPLGLLIEEQRTNTLTFSEQFDNAAWIEGSLTSVTPNTVISPDGTLNGDTVEATGTNTTQNFLYDSYITSIVSGSVFTFSVWLKADVPQTIQLRIANASNTDGGDLAISVTTEWQRYTITRTFTTTSTSVRAYVFRSSEPVAFYAWGAQLEAGAFPTSYIPTTTAQVTRSADVALIQGSNFSSWFNVNEGTVFTGISCPYPITNQYFLSFDTSAATRMSLQNVNNFGYWFIRDNSVTQAGVTEGSISANTVFKAAAVYKINDFNLAANGTVDAGDNAGSVPPVNTLYLGSYILGNYINGHIRQIAYYPTRLQNSQLQAITA
jgi:hypothetical protein